MTEAGLKVWIDGVINSQLRHIDPSFVIIVIILKHQLLGLVMMTMTMTMTMIAAIILSRSPTVISNGSLHVPLQPTSMPCNIVHCTLLQCAPLSAFQVILCCTEMH